MPIPITCEFCEESYRITDKAAGKRIRCKECGEAISVPGSATARSADRGRSRSAPPPARSRAAGSSARESQRPARSRSSARGAQSKPHISNRRERDQSGGNTTNVIIGVGIAAFSLIAGGAFLVYAKMKPQPNALADNAQNIARQDLNQSLEAERARLNQMQAEGKRFRDEEMRRAQEQADKMQKDLDSFSSNMGPPDMTPPRINTQPGFTPPSSTPPGYLPGYTPPNSGRPDFGSPGSGSPRSGFGPPRGFSGGPGGQTNRGGSRSGSRAEIPSSADTDADLAAIRTAMASGDRISRSRAISVLRRSSRKAEAAKILGEHLGDSDESQIISALGQLGTPAEDILLQGLQNAIRNKTNRVTSFLFAIGRCGTEKSIPVLEEIANGTDRSAAGLANGILSQVRSRAGRR